MRKTLGITLAFTTLLLMGTLAHKVNERKNPVIVRVPQIVQRQEPDTPASPSSTTPVSAIQLEQLKQHVYYLADNKLAGRMTGEPGCDEAAAYIMKKFEEMGLATLRHEFIVQGNRKTANIYAYIEGTDPALKSEIVVIGAHYDHIGMGNNLNRDKGNRKIHPGADDNASGTAALIEIARAYASVKDKVRRTVVFQAYSAEELGLLGSEFYCANPLFPRDKPDLKKHVFMMNLDMIGYLDKGFYTVEFVGPESSVDIGLVVQELRKDYPFAGRVTGQASGSSDHAVFYNNHIPVAFIHTGLHDNYHTAMDTADKIDYAGLQEVARYAFELSWRVGQSEYPPIFNVAAFQYLKFHDHGHPED